MRDISAALLAHLQGESTTTAICWLIEKRDGTFLRATDHDEDVVIAETSPSSDLAGTYRAASNITVSDARQTADSNVQNAEVTGALEAPGELIRLDVTVAEIEAGLFDDAPVSQFLVDWSAPENGVDEFYRGYLGQVSRDSDLRYQVELRGLKQVLTQVFVRTYSEKCQVKRFGDAECKFDLATVRITGTVTAVTNAKRFDATLGATSPSVAAGFYNGGELLFTSGANAGTFRELKRDDNEDVVGQLSFWERFPNDPQVGDTFELTPGCERTRARCKLYSNLVNFRGYGVLMTGSDALLRGPGMITPEQIIEAARAWIGVPFVHQGRSRFGVDCIGLVICVRLSLGSWPAAAAHEPRYRRKALDDELLREIRRTCTRSASAEPGGLALIQWPAQKIPTHVALITGETMVHTYQRLERVLECGYRAQWRRWTHSTWRLPGVAYP